MKAEGILMTVIYDSNNLQQQVLGEQNPDSTLQYRIIQYCIPAEVENGFLLYNKLTGKIILLSLEEYSCISSPTFSLKPQILNLVKDWFIVPVDHDDMLLADQITALIDSFSNDSKLKSYTILPTSDCNARCFYCYESCLPKEHMSVNTANDVADYIINHSKDTAVRLKWFGGEPLYNSEVIDIISNRLIDNGTKFSSTMISNGYLFNDSIIKRAKNQWNLKSVQITLDGTKTIYNKTKAYINKKYGDPFTVVTDNIERLINAEISVSVRLNISKINYEDLFELVNWISNRYEKNVYLSVYSAMLYDNYDSSDDDLLDMISKYMNLETFISEKGLSKSKERGKKITRGCMAQSDAAVVISPTGVLGKCEHFYTDEKTFGSIYSESIDKNNLLYWKHRTITDECKTCINYISCGGYDSCPNFKGKCSIMKQLMLFKEKKFMYDIYRDYKDGKIVKNINEEQK